MRRTMTVTARGGEPVTVVVTVYRKSVWLSVEPLFNGEAILEPANADSLVHTLTQAVQEARSYKP